VSVERVLQLLQAGDLAGAATLAGQAIAGGASHPLLFDARGHLLLQQGHAQAALADFERALALAPSNPALHDSKARCLIALDRAGEALAACDRAIALAPGFAMAHYDKGWAAESLGELALAARCYVRARRLEPRMADAPARLASLAARRGDRSEAKALAEAALALDPQNGIATLALATARLGDGELEGLAERLTTLASDPRTAPQTRASALGLLGDVHDRQDRVADAFTAYRAANVELERLYRPRFAGIPGGVARVQRLQGEFVAIDPALWPALRGTGALAQEARHIFVLGFYRAGTTLLGQILASHPDVVTLEEKPAMIDAADDFLDAPGGLARLAALDEAGLEPYRARYWQNVRRLEPASGGKTVVDKLPLNSLALPVVARLFPAAKILFAVRDPRDVVFSCFRRSLSVNRDSYEMLDLERGARFYDAAMNFAEAARAVLPLNIRNVRNEDLVADFETEVRGMCGFLGLEWRDSMLDFAEQSRSRAIATPSAAQVARGLNSDGVGQWRRYRVQIARIEPILACWVRAFGY
jgi:tetratricopeptide (TPR) repeat protein